ncbi:hypothetical protein [Mesorhizobium sp. 131-2-1]|uniref:hypothetical protein n=1 Tax=Mesorhizobium sp. 131-2-1 TaxID=2744518 RepID=UPI0019260D55|nr:hypothetical protein [Mesorhizobium sp. 131-2-1]
MTALHQIVVCGIAPGGVYAVLIIALVLISRFAKRASSDHLASASFIDIHDTAGLPFLIVVPAIEPSSTARTPLAKAIDAKARRSAAPALQLGGRA